MKKILSMIVSIALLSGSMMFNWMVNAEESTGEEAFGLGAIKLTEEQLAAFHQSVDQVADMRLNSLALERLEESQPQTRSGNTLAAAEMGHEAVMVRDLASSPAVNLMSANVQLPSSADNSGNVSFPPIGNQGSSNSCTAWALGYYQATNNIALVRGQNAKNAADANDVRISPKFLYNLTNGGANAGSFQTDAMNVLCSYGAPSWSVCTGTTTSTTSNYRTWNPGAEIWESALANKMNRAAYIAIDPSDTDSFDVIRKALLNGYVVSFGTDVYGWTYKNSKSPVVEQVCTSVNSSEGPHFMTIVGYDDNLWTDINGNNTEDEGEKGAFKVANSWGTSYKNNGYVWLAYDALKSTSAISGANNTNREGAIWYNEVYFLEPKVSYTPSLVAELTLNTARRNQIKVEFGVSSANQTTPAILRDAAEHTYFYEDDPDDPITASQFIAFNYPVYGMGSGENYNFTTGTTAGDGVFSFDLTPLITEYFSTYPMETEPLRYYVRVSDNDADGNATILKSFQLHDRENNLTLTAAQSNLSADGSTVTAYTDSYQTSAAPGGLRAQIVNNALQIDWSTVSGAFGYEVEINGDTYTTATNTYTRTPVTPGRLYHIRVRSKDANEASDWSGYLNLSYCLYGDVNRDGLIQESDMELVYQYSANEANLDEEQILLADVDGNGRINGTDVIKLLDYIDNQVSSGSIGQEKVFTNTDRAVRFLKYGDVNKDGTVTSADQTLIFDGANGNAIFDNEQQVLADLDGNGVISISDVGILYDYINDGTLPPAGTYAAFYAD